jgi:hypothetical protein
VAPGNIFVRSDALGMKENKTLTHHLKI